MKRDYKLYINDIRESIKQIEEYLDVDSLSYLSLEGLLKSTNSPYGNFCTACFTGNYKIGGC